MQELKKLHEQKEDEIKSRLNEFSSLSESKYFKEFLFCLLTPQSNAQRCWKAVEELSSLKNLNQTNISNILKTKTRFHNTKTKRILQAKQNFQKILPNLSNNNIPQLRNYLANNVKGYGLKEASHFLRNIGKSNNKIAILDRHILKNLKENKIKSPKHYLEIEQKFLNYANSINIPADELDLLWWSRENGEIFK